MKKSKNNVIAMPDVSTRRLIEMKNSIDRISPTNSLLEGYLNSYENVGPIVYRASCAMLAESLNLMCRILDELKLSDGITPELTSQLSGKSIQTLKRDRKNNKGLPFEEKDRAIEYDSCAVLFHSWVEMGLDPDLFDYFEISDTAAA